MCKNDSTSSSRATQGVPRPVMTLNQYDQEIVKLLENGTKPEEITQFFDTEAMENFMTASAIHVDARRNPKPESRPGCDYPWGTYPADDTEGKILG